MKVLNYGSLNYDYVYQVDHMMQEGETQASKGMNTFDGGKGMNQSVALARAGVPVYHAGMVGEDGDTLIRNCAEAGVNVDYIKKIPGRSGHTIIQVDKNGQNCILLFGGSNRSQTKEYIDKVLNHFGEGDLLLLQNEVNLVDYLVDKAYEKKMQIALNPSPFDAALDSVDMNKITYFFINEIEGGQITGETEPDKILSVLRGKYSQAKVVLTLGSDGSVYQDATQKISQPIFKVPVVDTTAAGDTFTGYFIASILENMSVEEGLRMAAKASSIAVSRQGAAPSVPRREEVTI